LFEKSRGVEFDDARCVSIAIFNLQYRADMGLSDGFFLFLESILGFYPEGFFPF